jgi:hypothetical protein
MINKVKMYEELLRIKKMIRKMMLCKRKIGILVNMEICKMMRSI